MMSRRLYAKRLALLAQMASSNAVNALNPDEDMGSAMPKERVLQFLDEAKGLLALIEREAA